MAPTSRPKVSDWGRIQDSSRRRYFPKPDSAQRSYFTIKRAGSKIARIPIYRLVNVLFNDPELQRFTPGDITDHILSHEPWNNHRRNLRWASKSFNSRRRLPSATASATRGQRVRLTNRVTGEVREFESNLIAATAVGLDHGFVNRCVNGKMRSSEWAMEALCKEELLLPDEEWWPIFPDTTHPCVSSYGRWQPLASPTSRCTPLPRPSGYVWVWVQHPEKSRDVRKHFAMHDLVFEHYEPRPSPLHTVNHKNHNRSDNRRENLEWADKSEQIMDREMSGRVDTVRLNYRARLDGTTEWLQFEDVDALSVHIGISTANISSAANHSGKGRNTGHARNSTGQRYKLERVPDPDYEIPGEEWADIVDMDWLEGGKYAKLGTGRQGL